MLNPNQWLDCDDEMKMGSFIEKFTDERALRTFALLNGQAVTDHLVDARSRDALDIANAYLNGEVDRTVLETAYQNADAAYDDISAAHMSDDDPTDAEALIENAAMVAMWTAYPVGYTGVTPLQSARDAALHTAFYCFQMLGMQALEEQVPRFRESGLVQ